VARLARVDEPHRQHIAAAVLLHGFLEFDDAWHHPAGIERGLGGFSDGGVKAERTGPLVKHQFGEHEEGTGPDEQARQNNAEKDSEEQGQVHGSGI
jgi:hypothetical protein